MACLSLKLHNQETTNHCKAQTLQARESSELALSIRQSSRAPTTKALCKVANSLGFNTSRCRSRILTLTQTEWQSTRTGIGNRRETSLAFKMATTNLTTLCTRRWCKQKQEMLTRSRLPMSMQISLLEATLLLLQSGLINLDLHLSTQKSSQ